MTKNHEAWSEAFARGEAAKAAAHDRRTPLVPGPDPETPPEPDPEPQIEPEPETGE